jgi:Family of unknown function (DUF6076)
MRIELVREDRLALLSGAVYSIAKPVNDVLGLRDDERYTEWLDQEWGELAPTRATIAKMVGPRKKAEPEAHFRDDFAEIAETAHAPGGSIDYARLAPLLSQVRYYPGGIEIPSLAVLAPWALERAARGVYWFGNCTRCERPFFAQSVVGRPSIAAALEPRYCSRPAPGLTVTCSQLEATDRFARERSEWSKEYRKVMARKLRGTVSERDFRAWKAVSSPGKRGEDWTPFDEWKEQQNG